MSVLLQIYFLPILVGSSFGATLQTVEKYIPLEALLPTIQQRDFQLITEKNKYFLKISLPDSNRTETVELKDFGTPVQALSVDGFNSFVYPDTQKTSFIYYNAGRDGYTTQFAYKSMFSEDFNGGGSNEGSDDDGGSIGIVFGTIESLSAKLFMSSTG